MRALKGADLARRSIDAGLGSEQLDLEAFGAQLLEDVNPFQAAALEPDVENDEGRLPGLDLCQSLRGIGGIPRGVALVSEHAADQHADIRLVVDDQDVMRHDRPCSFASAG